MFKISKLKELYNEIINIDYITITKNNFLTKTKDEYKTLSFEIIAKDEKDEYYFLFDLNCKLEELLNLEKNKTIDFNKYIILSETFFYINKIISSEPYIKIEANRYLNNKFLIMLSFNASVEQNDYYGNIEFEFNLDDYIK